MNETILARNIYGDFMIQRVLLQDDSNPQYVVQRGYYRVGNRLFDSVADAKLWIDHGHADRDLAHLLKAPE